MKRKLMIGLTPRWIKMYDSDASCNINDYASYLLSAGIPVLPLTLPLCDDALAQSAAGMFDGLLITGGADISPSIYHADAEEQTSCDPWVYDQSDLALYRAFRDAGKPIFGICRGIQLINAAEGGTLIQDIPSLLDTEHNQHKFKPEDIVSGTAHPVRLVPGTALSRMLGSITRVNSFHHQAVDTPAPGFTVSAYADDGVIEGIEKDRILAVQWHPERMKDDPRQIALAAEFLKCCAESDKQSLK